MDVKKMVSFCKSTLFFIRGKREVDMSPLSSNAFRSTKTKNDIHACGNNTTHSHRPVRRAARPKPSLFSRLCKKARPPFSPLPAGRGPETMLIPWAHFSSRCFDSDAILMRCRHYSKRPKARDAAFSRHHHHRRETPTT